MRISKTNPFVARWLFGLVAVVLVFFAYLATPDDEAALSAAGCLMAALTVKED